MGRCARESVNPLQRSSVGWIPVRIGRLSTVVGRRHPITVHNGVIDGRVNETGVSTAAPGRSAVLCC